MLLRVMFLLTLVAVLSETIVHGAAALAQVALHERAVDVARLAFVTAIRTAQDAAASGTVPAPIATCGYADAAGCEIAVQTTFATPTPGPMATSCPGTPCSVVLQSNSLVAEGRAVFLISSAVSAANGAALASRSGLVTFRTFSNAPHASIAGSADATLDALMRGGSGDDAGSPSTLITVEYDSSSGGVATPGNAWQTSIESPPSAAPGWER